MAKVVAIIQARMGSSRFPGKVLAGLGDHKVLDGCIVAACTAGVDAVIVAVPWQCFEVAHHVTNAQYMREVNAWMAPVDVPECDVGRRLFVVAAAYGADIVVRICGDSPLMCPKNIDRCVEGLQNRGADYCAFAFRDGTPAITTKAGKYPEAFTFRALKELIDQREHVTQPFYRKPWKVAWVAADEEDKAANNTIDTPEDLERLRLQLQSEPAAC